MHWKATLVVFICIIVYNLIGGAIFQALEQPTEEATKSESVSIYQTFLGNYSSIDTGNLQKLLEAYKNAADLGVTFTFSDNGTLIVEYTTTSNWDFWNSFFFSMTAMTTIGYGNISPATSGGKAMVCVYALIGIPLFGILMMGIGEIQGRKYEKIREQLESADCLNGKPKLTSALYITILVVILFLIFLLLPALIFVFTEGWTYGEGVYYTLITLTTIGFGDYVAGQTARDASRTIYKIALYIWIILGLCYMAMIIDQISAVLKKGVNKMNNSMAKLKRVESGSKTSEEKGGGVELTAVENKGYATE